MGQVSCCVAREREDESDHPEGFVKDGGPSCSCSDFKSLGICKHLPGGTPRPAGPSCSCSDFKRTGCCKHLPPSMGGLPQTPRGAKQDTKEDSDSEDERRPVKPDTKRITWYMKEGKKVPARQPNEHRCGLFLDIDGVLHPFGAFGKESFCHLSHLIRILDATQCDVVLSSSWRMDAEGIQEVNDRLREARPGLDAGKVEVLDITDRTKGSLNHVGNRDIEILAWVKAHAKEAGFDNRWIALDDLNLVEALGEEHAVVTDYETGLTEEKVVEAIRKLKALVGQNGNGPKID